jgi:FkbM family methyltransferase
MSDVTNLFSDSAVNPEALTDAVAQAGLNERLRSMMFDALRQAEREAADPLSFRSHVRWPIVSSLLGKARTHRVSLSSGLTFEVGPDSRIEQALLLSAESRPDHVWEPQTTKLLVALATQAAHVIIGGAYIGDQVLPVAQAMSKTTPQGIVHAFEPMENAFRRLLRHLELNNITNVCAHQLCLWDSSGVPMNVVGPAALATSLPAKQGAISPHNTVASITIDDYVNARTLPSVGLIMLDIEGNEHRALLGCTNLLSRRSSEAPHVVFEVHRNYVDWSDGLEKTPIVELLRSNGYSVFAIRDFHDNHAMAGKPIELIPVDRVYLQGPPHGFNLLATKDAELVQRFGLRVVENVSPKLLVDRNPALHHPLDGL